jgi:hypothetical protein
MKTAIETLNMLRQAYGEDRRVTDRTLMKCQQMFRDLEFSHGTACGFRLKLL